MNLGSVAFVDDSSITNSGKKRTEKTAEKTVSKIRLKQIEREHRSIGSIIDDRHVYELEEVKPRGKMIEVDKVESKNKLNDASVPSPEKSSLNMKEFQDEQMIWKSKSRAPNYILKRRFDDPELQSFRYSMNSYQKKEYSNKTREAVLNLSQNLRSNLSDLKQQMDSKGVFHPEANAHRVHCLYLLKLYRGCELFIRFTNLCLKFRFTFH